jgi:hypothetical protein
MLSDGVAVREDSGRSSEEFGLWQMRLVMPVSGVNSGMALMMAGSFRARSAGDWSNVSPEGALAREGAPHWAFFPCSSPVACVNIPQKQDACLETGGNERGCGANMRLNECP